MRKLAWRRAPSGLLLWRLHLNLAQPLHPSWRPAALLWRPPGSRLAGRQVPAGMAAACGPVHIRTIFTVFAHHPSYIYIAPRDTVPKGQIYSTFLSSQTIMQNRMSSLAAFLNAFQVDQRKEKSKAGNSAALMAGNQHSMPKAAHQMVKVVSGRVEESHALTGGHGCYVRDINGGQPPRRTLLPKMPRPPGLLKQLLSFLHNVLRRGM